MTRKKNIKAEKEFEYIIYSTVELSEVRVIQFRGVTNSKLNSTINQLRGSLY